MQTTASKKQIITRPLTRLIVALIATPILCVAIIGGFAAATPMGPVDRIILPILLFPFLMAVLPLSIYLIKDIKHVAALSVLLVGLNGLLIYLQLT